MADGEDVPRLSAVVERQRRELARAGPMREAAVVVATARGVLMERHGLSLCRGRPPARGHGRRRGAAAAGDGRRGARRGSAVPAGPGTAARARPRGGAVLGLGGRRASPSRRPSGRRTAPSSSVPSPRSCGPGSAPPRSRCGCSTPTARSSCTARTGSAAPRRAAGGGCRRSSTAWSSGWSPTGDDLWWPAGMPAADPVPATAPWGRGRRPRAARPAGPVRDPARRGRGLVAGQARRVRREHQGLGVRRARRVHRGARAAPVLRARGVDGAVAGDLDGARRAHASPCSWSGRCGAPGGTVTDFRIVHVSTGYVDPAGRPRAELAGLTLLEAYPASAIRRRPVRLGGTGAVERPRRAPAAAAPRAR